MSSLNYKYSLQTYKKSVIDIRYCIEVYSPQITQKPLDCYRNAIVLITSKLTDMISKTKKISTH